MNPGKNIKIVLVGFPNVGKSVVFHRLTGSYVIVSNYPGTTVEITRGESNKGYQVIDTPGMYSFRAISQEEKVTRQLLLEEAPDLILHVSDAKNLPRMLPLTLQLRAAGFPTVLVLNMMDEAEKIGLEINLPLLRRRLGIPVVGVVSVTGRGINELEQVIADCLRKGSASPPFSLFSSFSPGLQTEVSRLAPLMPPSVCRRRFLALLALQDDSLRDQLLLPKSAKQELDGISGEQRDCWQEEIAITLHRRAENILRGVVSTSGRGVNPWRRGLESLLVNPLTGGPIMLAVLYLLFYRFMGGFAAGTVVDILDNHLFGGLLIPWVEAIIEDLIPYPALQDIFVHDYGIFTLGIRYALAIILPIVGAFFLIFSLAEDSGYLPRLAYLADRAFKTVGLNGRAVIPFTLGLGCGTMAVLVTRTLESRRERFLATYFLALAIPCSAQMGIILGILSKSPFALFAWLITLMLVLFLESAVLNRLLPGRAPSFYMELPPLRFPQPAAVLRKTGARILWYMKEILPVFIGLSLLLWLMDWAGALVTLEQLAAPPMKWMGLPPEMGRVLLLGFFRRDYGAAGLYDLQAAGRLNGADLLAAAVVLTLFLPCVAQMGVIWKEQGFVRTLVIAAAVCITAVTAGWAVNMVIKLAGVLF